MGSCLGNTSKLPTDEAPRCKHVYYPYKTLRSQVLESLGCYQTDIDLRNITDIIMDYIPNDHRAITPIESSDGDNGYNIYYHSSPSLCPVWPKKFIDKQIKVIILGDKGIGKTSLIKRFTTNRFTEDYHDPTIDNFKKKIVNINNQQCMLDIEDYAGQQMIYTNSAINDHILRSGQIFICCFAIDSVKSFEKALIDRKRIIRCKEEYNDWSIMLVATKCDLMDNTMDWDEKKVVNTNKVIEQAKQWNIGYIETSAKYGVNVNRLFEQSILEYRIQSESDKYCDQPLRSQAIKPINL